MIERKELQSLSTALRRKLLLLNSDIRQERRRKYPSSAVLFSLCQTRKTLNQALVQCERALVLPFEPSHAELYAKVLALYQSS